MSGSSSMETTSPHLPRPSIDRAMAAAELDKEILQDKLAMQYYGDDDVHDPPLQKFSAASSITHVASKEEHIGTLITWDGPDDPKNPLNWSHRYQWFITVVCGILTVNVTFASSAPTAATFAIADYFNVSLEISFLTTTVFLIGYVFGPLLWGPGSEVYGRRNVLLFAMTMYTIFHLGQALAHNIETFLVTRFLCGLFAVAPLTICGGIIADVWSPEGRGRATSLYTTCVFLGPVLGPIIGGVIVQEGLGWQWIFWVMMMFAGASTILAAVFLPETYAPVILLRKTNALRKSNPEKSEDIYADHELGDWSFKGVIHRTLYRPFDMLFKEPILVLITIYLSLIYGILYCLFEALPIIFTGHLHFTSIQTGLIFIGVGIGSTLGAVLNVLLTSHYPKLIIRWKGFPPPEQRLFGAMVGGICLVIGCFWLGWTGEYVGTGGNVGWWWPALSTVLIGMSISMTFMSFLSYLVDTYMMYSASAFAANTMIRSVVAAAFPLFTVQMFSKLGINWACTLFGLIGLVLSPSPFLFYRYGPRIRAGSKFAPCIDLKIAEELKLEDVAAAEINTV